MRIVYFDETYFPRVLWEAAACGWFDFVGKLLHRAKPCEASLVLKWFCQLDDRFESQRTPPLAHPSMDFWSFFWCCSSPAVEKAVNYEFVQESDDEDDP